MFGRRPAGCNQVGLARSLSLFLPCQLRARACDKLLGNVRLVRTSSLAARARAPVSKQTRAALANVGAIGAQPANCSQRAKEQRSEHFRVAQNVRRASWLVRSLSLSLCFLRSQRQWPSAAASIGPASRSASHSPARSLARWAPIRFGQREQMGPNGRGAGGERQRRRASESALKAAPFRLIGPNWPVYFAPTAHGALRWLEATWSSARRRLLTCPASGLRNQRRPVGASDSRTPVRPGGSCATRLAGAQTRGQSTRNRVQLFPRACAALCVRARFRPAKVCVRFCVRVRGAQLVALSQRVASPTEPAGAPEGVRQMSD